MGLLKTPTYLFPSLFVKNKSWKRHVNLSSRSGSWRFYKKNVELCLGRLEKGLRERPEGLNWTYGHMACKQTSPHLLETVHARKVEALRWFS